MLRTTRPPHRQCEVITGVTIVYPILHAPGYQVRSLSEITKVHFADNPAEVLQAYLENGEGFDRAGGVDIQGKGAMLVKSIEGDYNNVVGFPLFS
jgi:septum formation protein